MSPKEEFQVRGKRFASWLNRNGMNEQVNFARAIATRTNATRVSEDQLTEGEILLFALVDGLDSRHKWTELDEGITSNADRLKTKMVRQGNLIPPTKNTPIESLDDDQPFDL